MLLPRWNKPPFACKPLCVQMDREIRKKAAGLFFQEAKIPCSP